MAATIHTDTTGSAKVDAIKGSGIAAWFIAAVVLACVSSLIFRSFTMPLGARFGVVLLPVPALIGLVFAIARAGRRLDEFEERVQLEAIAYAFVIACLAFIVFAQFQAAGMLGPEDWFMPWLAIGGGYVVGLTSAKRRYQ